MLSFQDRKEIAEAIKNKLTSRMKTNENNDEATENAEEATTETENLSANQIAANSLQKIATKLFSPPEQINLPVQTNLTQVRSATQQNAEDAKESKFDSLLNSLDNDLIEIETTAKSCFKPTTISGCPYIAINGINFFIAINVQIAKDEQKRLERETNTKHTKRGAVLRPSQEEIALWQEKVTAQDKKKAQKALQKMKPKQRAEFMQQMKYQLEENAMQAEEEEEDNDLMEYEPEEEHEAEFETPSASTHDTDWEDVVAEDEDRSTIIEASVYILNSPPESKKFLDDFNNLIWLLKTGKYSSPENVREMKSRQAKIKQIELNIMNQINDYIGLRLECYAVSGFISFFYALNTFNYHALSKKSQKLLIGSSDSLVVKARVEKIPSMLKTIFSNLKENLPILLRTMCALHCASDILTEMSNSNLQNRITLKDIQNVYNTYYVDDFLAHNKSVSLPNNSCNYVRMILYAISEKNGDKLFSYNILNDRLLLDNIKALNQQIQNTQSFILEK